ncbi:MAG: sensor domain-containing diguanylate cyclase [Gammaproteobacteria bacterium]|nr:sensor domain-containing diguanylate cyclase [Gammaproteobacteria bacterium]
MSRHIFKVTLLLILLFCTKTGPAFGQQTDNTLLLDKSASVYKTSSALSFYIDQDGSKSISDISRAKFKENFSASKFDPPVFKKSASTIWARLEINNLASSVRHYLFYDYFAIYKLQLFTDGDNHSDKAIKAGRYFTETDQSLHKRHTILPLELNEGKNILYFKIEQPFESLDLNLLVADAIGIAELSAQNTAEISIYTALVTAFFLFNIIIFLVIRNKAYLFYSLHIIFIGVFFAGFYGLPSTWLNISPYYNNAFTPNFMSQIAGIFSILFFVHFLKVRERSERTYQFFKIIIYAVIANMFLMLTGWRFSLESWLLILGIGSVSQLMFSVKYIRQDPYCVFFTVAWGLHLTIIILYLLRITEISETHISKVFIMLGNIVEMMILTFALGYRFTRILKEKEVIEKTVSQVLKREDSLVQLSYQDPLTGTYNRRKFDELLVQKTQDGYSEQSGFCLIMLDIDHFKEVNDQYGHDTGDQILKSFTLVLSNLLRKSDTFCRFGGEEFIIIIESGTLTDANSLAEKIRRTLESKPLLEQNISITLSCGVTCFMQNDSPSSLIQRVDEALYRAKNEGRNKVVSTCIA